MFNESLKITAFQKRLKKHVIGKPHHFLAISPLGFEQTLAEELNFLGIETLNEVANSKNNETTNSIQVLGDGKIQFYAKITEAWKAIACSRIANRVLMQISSFKAENFSQLEKKLNEIPWDLYVNLKENSKIQIQVNCKHSRLYHSDAIAERIQKFIQKKRDKSKINTSINDLIYVYFLNDKCTLWLDLAGEELYKRGQKRFITEAPLKETIASAMIFESLNNNKNSNKNFNFPNQNITIIDPMAGSGTFSLESLYISNNIIPGISRDFSFKHQPSFKEPTWKHILKKQNIKLSNIKNSFNIITSDISPKSVDIIKHNTNTFYNTINLETPILKSSLNIQVKDFFEYSINDLTHNNQLSKNVIILLNPPYGKRLECNAPLLYKKIGEKINQFLMASKQNKITLTIAILVPKDTFNYKQNNSCLSNLFKTCKMLNPMHNKNSKIIKTSHGGFSLNAIFAKFCET